jgi:hypothetical protein
MAELPPLSPEGELRIGDDPTFVKDCVQQVSRMSEGMRIIVGEPLLTHNDHWGSIWRADYLFPDTDLSPRINRIVCARASDGKLQVVFAVGQAIEPLR